MNGNRKIKKAAIVGLSAVLGGSCVSYGVYAATANNNSNNAECVQSDTYDVEYLQAAVEQAAKTISGKDTADDSLFKSETVYVLADAAGSVDKIIVSDWLKNAGTSSSVSDMSELENITNIKGDETFTTNGNKLTWNAESQDIFYQGTTDKELPVSMKITYELDGKEITPEELVGKSGKLTMHVEYTNNSKETVNLNGETTTIYTPFAMVTGMMLPLDNFENVTIDNGTVISDAKSNIVVGVALPGLTESLGIESDDFEIPQSLTITADVTDFEMGVTLTVATSDFLSNIETGEISSIDDIQDSINTLVESSTKLVDGTESLKEGTETLSDALGELEDGAGTLSTGVSAYVDGVDTLTSGLSEYVSGTDTLSNGVKTYTTGVSQLTAGILQFGDASSSLTAGVGTLATGVSQAAAGVSQLNSGMPALTAGSAAVVDGVKQVNQGLTSVDGALDTMDGYYNQLLQTIQSNQQVLNGLKQAAAADASVAASLQPAIQGLETTINYQTQIVNGLKASVAEGSDLKNGLDQLIATTSESNISNQSTLIGGAYAVSAGVSQAAAGISTVDGAMQQINAGTQTLNASVAALPDAISQLTSGAEAINQATPALVSGADALLAAGNKISGGVSELTGNNQTLKDGAAKLYDASIQLKEGGDTLKDGAEQLYEGMSQFDEDGIQKINTLYENDLKSILDRLDAVLDSGKAYNSFSGISDDMSGSVKFIIETDEISK